MPHAVAEPYLAADVSSRRVDMRRPSDRGRAAAADIEKHPYEIVWSLLRDRVTAAGAHKTVGLRAVRLAALEDRDARDERCDIAIDPLHEAPAAGGHVVDEFRQMEPQAVHVDRQT
jgi:hypothetical protein